MTDLAAYPRQRLQKPGCRGKTETIIPLNDFLEGIRPGIGVVSRNTEEEILATATEHSYRKTAAIVAKKLAKETIRREVLKTGEKAKSLPAVRAAGRVIPEKRLKDAGDQSQTYKCGQGSPIRQRLGAALGWLRIYLLVDERARCSRRRKGQTARRAESAKRAQLCVNRAKK